MRVGEGAPAILHLILCSAWGVALRGDEWGWEQGGVGGGGDQGVEHATGQQLVGQGRGEGGGSRVVHGGHAVIHD